MQPWSSLASCLSVFLVRSLSRKDWSDSASRVGGALVIGGLYNVYFWFDFKTSPEYCKTFCEMDVDSEESLCFLAGVIGLLSDKFRVCLKPGVRSAEKSTPNADWLWRLVIVVRKLSESSFRSVSAVCWPYHYKTSGSFAIPIGVRRRVFSDSEFRVGKPINLWKANLHCLSEFIKRYLQKFQVHSSSWKSLAGA